VSCTFHSDKEGNADLIAETLLEILQAAKQLNPDFLQTENGFEVKTNLTFPKNWGLGTSSTLINSIANWAEVDAFQLLWNSFKGSGYDVACAQNNTPIYYQIKNKKPVITTVAFNPSFKEHLFFVYLNEKQDSKEGILAYRKQKEQREMHQNIERVSQISEAFVKATTLDVFNTLIIAHEKIIGEIIQIKPVKERLFPDYFGEVKSLGAWGGDFVLVTGNEQTPDYFKNKGFNTVLRYHEIIL
jgi:mevalonate kinase